MKVQFKYVFLAGLRTRGGVFAIIFVMNLVFITLGALGALPEAALITAVSLGGVAIGLMAVVNIIYDVAIIRRMYAAPGAYLYALTPAPRWKTLLANIIAMAAMDIVTMAAVIVAEVLLAMNLAGNYIGGQVWNELWGLAGANVSDIMFGLWFVALLVAAYLLIMIFIIFCLMARRSIFYHKPFGTVLTVALAAVCLYIFNLMQFALAPFGVVTRWGMFFTIHIGRGGMVAITFLTIIQLAALFVVTSRLMERKLNI